MSAAHFIYIPGVMMVGIVLGFILGARAAKDAYEVERQRRQGKRSPEP